MNGLSLDWVGRALRDEHETSYEGHRKVIDSCFLEVDPRAGALLAARRRVSNTGALRASRRFLRTQRAEVLAAQLRAREDGGLVGDYQILRLAEIALLCRRFAPKSVLELGSGASTAMFAEEVGRRGRVVTVEESPHWRDRLLDYMDPWTGCFESLRADRVIAEDPVGQVASWYDFDHDDDFDLVYVDGPSNYDLDGMTDREHEVALQVDPAGPHLANIDAELLWRAGHLPKVVVIDARRNTVRRLVTAAGDRYRVFLRSDYRDRTSQRSAYFLYHTVLIRRDR